MTTDYIVASLPVLTFGEKPAITSAGLAELAGDRLAKPLARWRDLEAQLRNAMAVCRGGGEKDLRQVDGCSQYWKSRVLQCFEEKDVFKRDELLDRVWWDAAGELTPSASPLGVGALATYSVRLKIAEKRALISTSQGNALFDTLVERSGAQAQ